MTTTVPVANGVKVKRVRFEVSIQDTNGDYRPLTWPIRHPYWCSASSETDFILIAYVESEEQLLEQWPEAKHLDVMESDLTHYTFSERFTRPEWFKS